MHSRHGQRRNGNREEKATYEVEEADPRRDDDRAVREVAARKDGALRELELPVGDHGEKDTANDEHGNHRCCRESVNLTAHCGESAHLRLSQPPFALFASVSGSRMSATLVPTSARPTMSSCWANVHAFVHHVRRNGTCTGGSARPGLSGGRLQDPEPLRLLLGPEEGNDERRERGGDEDRKHAVC